MMSVQYQYYIYANIDWYIVYIIFLTLTFNFLFLLLKYTITCIIHNFFSTFLQILILYD